MALFGGQRRPDWGRVASFVLQGPNGLERRDAREAAMAEQRRLEEERKRQEMIQDRLRAQLSPADTPMGSGTGQLPNMEQQMAALDEAQLLSPEAAAPFAALVGQRRMGQMTQGRSPEEQLAIILNPEAAGSSFASQFKDDVMAPGSIRTRGDRTVAAAPVTQRFDDRFGTIDPRNPGQVTYTDPRSPSFAEQTQRITAERPQLANLSPGQQSFGVDPYGRATPLAENNRTAPVDPKDVERQQWALESQTAQISNVRNALGRAKTQIGRWTTGPAAGLAVIGGTQAADLAATLDTIEANLSFQALAEMRANSPTGGALGSITERELQLLGSTVSSLRQSQSPAQLRQSLTTIENMLNALEERAEGQSGQGQAQISREAAIAELRRRGRIR